ncbi:hypothetical protein [Solirubrobacter soli]|uniref:hypothetical protein n=1 Tax=Solirubrobacter soli TaxID=363832 RepID=UPI000406375B|nr:hypothetical protein [Solirubrobacter soli]
MPASKSPDTRHSEAGIVAAVTRLSRPHGDGDAIIERAAILAEGTPSAAIEAWVIDHGGRPETRTTTSRGRGQYRVGHDAPSGHGRVPQRYVFPAAALSEDS